ncbi:hypothetical protein Gohar_010302 [Gossypium harknessii]|uniref:Uncharacterized protein n=1 Tax=Gossypium harknessii TaxID=34285 RepID=A0A7J9GQF7_9ROSI|nr:hypothetical protein [Gossypium harknessii]
MVIRTKEILSFGQAKLTRIKSRIYKIVTGKKHEYAILNYDKELGGNNYTEGPIGGEVKPETGKFIEVRLGIMIAQTKKKSAKGYLEQIVHRKVAKDVLATKKLLQKGKAWRVGRGDNISIWQNAWVLGLKNHKIQESVRNHNLDKVVDLIDPILRQWKEGIITSTFVRGKAEAILNTPLARYPREDCRVWSGEPIGDYTVRSGYKRLIMEDPSLTTDDAENTVTQFYKNLWQTYLHGKVKIRNWKVYNNFIPTFDNLQFKTNKALDEGIHQTVIETMKFIQTYLGEWEMANNNLPGHRIEDQ